MLLVFALYFVAKATYEPKQCLPPVTCSQHQFHPLRLFEAWPQHHKPQHISLSMRQGPSKMVKWCLLCSYPLSMQLGYCLSCRGVQ